MERRPDASLICAVNLLFDLAMTVPVPLVRFLGLPTTPPSEGFEGVQRRCRLRPGRRDRNRIATGRPPATRSGERFRWWALEDLNL